MDNNRKVVRENKTRQDTPAQIQNINKAVISNLKREHQRLQRKIAVSHQLLPKIKLFTISKTNNYYLGFGGLGDAILLLASCWNDPKAKVVFFANQQTFVKEFFDLFNIPVFLHDNIMGSPIANAVHDFMLKLPTFRESAHLADHLDYGDWRSEHKYIPRIKKSAEWIEKFGTITSEKPIFILAPTGSHRDHGRQRFLSNEEYKKIIRKHIDDGYQVYASGSISDYHYFGVKDDFRWLSSELIIDKHGQRKEINLHHMLQVINSASKVISMDTWLKSYTLLCGIPTTVIMTRWHGKYVSYGQDVTDWIFLNPNIWPSIMLQKVEELIP